MPNPLIDRISFRCRLSFFIGLALAGVAGSAGAQSADTLQKIANTGTVTLGVREASGALSFAVGDGTYGGFHVEMAERILKDIQKQLHLPKLDVQRVLLTSQNRIGMVTSGKVDLECGATVNNNARQASVAFAITTYVEELRIAVKRDSGIASVAQLNGKTVAITRGTTATKALRDAAAAAGVTYTELSPDSHTQAFALLQSGQAEAFVMDTQVLAAAVAAADNPGAYRILGQVLAAEPVACMMRKDDPAFRKAVDDSIRRQIADGSLAKLYNQWFVQRPIPPVNRPMAWPATSSTRTAWSKPNNEPMETYGPGGTLMAPPRALAYDGISAGRGMSVSSTSESPDTASTSLSSGSIRSRGKPVSTAINTCEAEIRSGGATRGESQSNIEGFVESYRDMIQHQEIVFTKQFLEGKDRYLRGDNSPYAPNFANSAYQEARQCIIAALERKVRAEGQGGGGNSQASAGGRSTGAAETLAGSSNAANRPTAGAALVRETQPPVHCMSLQMTGAGGLQAVNNCGFNVIYAYCFVGGTSPGVLVQRQKQCKEAAQNGFNHDDAAPGVTKNDGGVPKGASVVSVFACRREMGPARYLPAKLNWNGSVMSGECQRFVDETSTLESRSNGAVR